LLEVAEVAVLYLEIMRLVVVAVQAVIDVLLQANHPVVVHRPKESYP
jgi:hypothetical protein